MAHDVRLQLTVTGLDALRARLDDSGARRARVVRAIRAIGLLIERAAKTRAPVRTGTLRRSIAAVSTDGGMGVTVGPSVGYGKFVEFGWGQLGARTGHPFGDYEYLDRVHRGMAARPFLVPGFREVRPRINRILADLGLSIARHIAGRES